MHMAEPGKSITMYIAKLIYIGELKLDEATYKEKYNIMRRRTSSFILVKNLLGSLTTELFLLT